MIRNKLLITIVLFSALFISCNSSDRFKVSKGMVGSLTTKTTMQELEKIFKNDSIVKNLSEGSLGDNYFQDDDEYHIFEKGGKHLLTIVPKEQLDSTSTIKSIQIFDNRFETETGISLNSTFVDINLKSTINKVTEKEREKKEERKTRRSSSRKSTRQNPIIKVLTSATFIRSVFGILKKVMR